MRVRGEHIHMFHRRREGAEGLDAIEAEKNAPLAQSSSDRGIIQPETADEMTRRERDQPRIFVHLPEHIPGADDAKAATVARALREQLLARYQADAPSVGRSAELAGAVGD